jgi:hypothetical protein
MENVELFELYAGKVLALLYLRFPLATELKVERIVDGLQADGIGATDCREIAGHTIRWLERAGYLEPATKDQVGSFRGTLTAKGFECLRALPEHLQEVKPRKEAVRPRKEGCHRNAGRQVGRSGR